MILTTTELEVRNIKFKVEITSAGKFQTCS